MFPALFSSGSINISSRVREAGTLLGAEASTTEPERKRFLLVLVPEEVSPEGGGGAGEQGAGWGLVLSQSGSRYPRVHLGQVT